MFQYFRNPFKKQSETYAGDRSCKDLYVAKKNFLIQEELFWEMVDMCTLSKNILPYLKAK